MIFKETDDEGKLNNSHTPDPESNGQRIIGPNRGHDFEHKKLVFCFFFF